MEEEEQLSAPQPHVYRLLVSRRRQLLPWWVLFFTWFFMLGLFLLPVGIIFRVSGKEFMLSLFGFTTYDPFSVAGIFLAIMFAFKGVVALNLWLEKKRAVSLARIDAILSIGISLISIFIKIAMPNNIPGVHSFSLPLELVVVIPYYIKMNRVQYDWENFGEVISPQEDINLNTHNI